VPPLLEARGLHLALPDRTRKPLLGAAPLLPILRDVSLTVGRGESVGLVGESGSGKSTLGRTLLRIYRPQAGSICFDGEDITNLPERALRRLRPRLQMVFQDSQAALNPCRTVAQSLALPLVVHGLAEGLALRRRVAALLDQVQLPAAFLDRYPHQLSGGQRQRVGIARALALAPEFLLADEVVSGLDVSVQVQILDLLRELRRDRHLALLFISHDLSVVRALCDRVVVMRHGTIVEAGDCATLFAAPQHPYTRALIRAIPLPVVDPHWLDQPQDEEA
jgi:peptide/nickel transport system ATP-binding protein